MAAILFLILRIKLHAFVALLLGSLLIGVAAGMPLADVLVSVTDGMANSLGVIAVLVGLGAMFGQMLESAGRLMEARTHFEAARRNDPGKPNYRTQDFDQLRERFPEALAVTHWAGTWIGHDQG